MNTKLIVALAGLLLAVPAVSSYTYHRFATGPSGAHSSVFGDVHVAKCDNGVIADLLSFLDCDTGGVGAIIDVSDISTQANYVGGTCNVRQTASIAAGIGHFSYTCGTDRDNDGFVTNLDLSQTVLGDKNTGTDQAARGDTLLAWDDDFANADVAPGQQGSANICFRADVDSVRASWDHYPTSAVWDTFMVFIAVNGDSTAITEGIFSVDVVVNDYADGGCTPSSQVSSTWTGT